MGSVDSVVIIGGGQAGMQTAASLRQWGYEGALSLVGEEPVPPYQRPPLTKAYMKGQMPEDRLFFKPASWFEDHNVDLVLATRATAIVREQRRVEIEHGGHLDYDALVIATGARPRSLPVPGADLEHVYDLRSVTDVERIRPQMMEGRKLVIVGAGYIGLEAAASARQMGMEVTVLEMADRVLERVTSPEVSAFFEGEHRNQGVQIRTGTRLQGLAGSNGRVTSALTADGEELAADMVLVGIGIVPNVDLAADAGLTCNDGIMVDRDARTDDPAIFAIGDCARRPLVHYGGEGRIESVHNAVEQGRIAAAAILDRQRPVEDCPWFWSDQYDLKLQIAGLFNGYDTTVVRGDPAARHFAVFYLAGDRLLAVDAINSAAEFVGSKRLIQAGAAVDRSLLADAAVPMKQIAQAALDP